MASVEPGSADNMEDNFGSENDLLDDLVESSRSPPLARSCSEISALTTCSDRKESTASCSEFECTNDRRDRTESSSSASSIFVKAVGTMGRKRSRKRDRFRKEVRRLTTTVIKLPIIEYEFDIL